MINRPMPGKSDVDALRARLTASLASLSAVQTEIEIDSAATAADDQAFDDERAEAARRGELGPDWQKIQQRIDLGTTTLDDVFSGRDDSREAAALLTQSRTTLNETIL
jgi:acyl-homoserine lactone acylase PvdQ